MGAFNTPTESHFLKNVNGGFVLCFKAADWLYHLIWAKFINSQTTAFFYLAIV
jgi:hypothetical protein